MEPVKAHGTALPQQGPTRPSGPRPEDLMQEGHKGANPYAGQREATTNTDDRSMNTDNPTTLTKLDMYNILVEKARTHGEKNRPPDLEINERTLSVLNALYPDGIPNNIDIECKV